MNWQPMETAPRDGTEFVHLRRIAVIGVGQPTRYVYEARTMRRHWMHEPREGRGYWLSQYGSVADHDATGWWSPLPESKP